MKLGVWLAVVLGAASVAITVVGVAVPVIDATVWTDQADALPTVVSPAFATTAPNELLLAFIATDFFGSGPNTSVTTVTGAGLAWTLVRRTNVQGGTSEIWRAFAPSALSGVTVTAALSQPMSATLTVVSVRNVDTTGNGAGAIGATATANRTSGAPTATLVTTRNNSWVFGVGNDNDNALARTVGPGQTLVHQYLAPVGDTFWVQRQTSVTPLAGTSVTINATAPTGDRSNLTLCEIRSMAPDTKP